MGCLPRDPTSSYTARHVETMTSDELMVAYVTGAWLVYTRELRSYLVRCTCASSWQTHFYVDGPNWMGSVFKGNLRLATPQDMLKL